MISSPTERYLIDFHDRKPGATSNAFGKLNAYRGAIEFASSYECLVEVVPENAATISVLDVACGDGFLLERLAARQQLGLSLLGMDMSAGELDKASHRLGHTAKLSLGRAQALPFSTASVDVALSHMALMLMDDVDQVLLEVHRVMKPGALLSFIVSGRRPDNAVFDTWVKLLRPAMDSDGVPNIRFGDPRIRTEEGLEELLAGRFEKIQISNIRVPFNTSPSGLWEWYIDTYDVDRLSVSGRETLRIAFLREIDSLKVDGGLIPSIAELRQVTALAI